MRTSAPVAITGLGLVCPAGESLAASLRTLDEQREFSPVPPPFVTAFTFPVFTCPAELPLSGPRPINASRSTLLALLAACEALADAGFSPDGHDSPRLGVIVGTSVGASLSLREFHAILAAGGEPPLHEVEEYLEANPGLALGRFFGCSGPAQCVTTACSSGADAIGIGAGWIRMGLCDTVLAGGTDALSPTTYAGFSSLRLPSPTVCRPFDARRDGLTLGEGAAFMLLEAEHSRARRKPRIWGHIAGYGTGTDAYHMTAPHPEGRGLLAAVTQAFAQAGAGWEDLAFINAHGTATPTNDAAEGAFFSRYCPTVPVLGTKGATGHTLGAAGAVEAVLTTAHLATGRVPGTPNFHEPDPALAFASVREATPVSGRFALSQSLAFGGNNSALLIAGGDS